MGLNIVEYRGQTPRYPPCITINAIPASPGRPYSHSSTLPCIPAYFRTNYVTAPPSPHFLFAGLYPCRISLWSVEGSPDLHRIVLPAIYLSILRLSLASQRPSLPTHLCCFFYHISLSSIGIVSRLTLPFSIVDGLLR